MDGFAATAQWQKLRLPTARFVLNAYVPTPELAPSLAEQARVLTIYIEGDGLAWVSGRQPSSDPTPGQPVALQMALRHPGKAAAYLSRPCQNISQADWGNCAESWWTDRRYAGEVIAASDQAISTLKTRAGAQQLVLVGYSGGGVVAALVAAGRSDVIGLVTVSANMDTQAWTTLHRVTPLSASLNPADAWAALQNLPQLHFVGGKDLVAPIEVFTAYANHFPPAKRPRMRLLPDVDHSCCWAVQWPRLLREARAELGLPGN